MTDDKIFEQIRPIIAKKFGVAQSAVTRQASLTKDLGADSMDIFELIMKVERYFWISIPDSEQEKIKTVDGIVKAVKKFGPENWENKKRSVSSRLLAKQYTK